MQNLVLEVQEVSSQDQDEEAGSNVLRPSVCYKYFSQQVHTPMAELLHPQVLYTLQEFCGCAMGRPCYWCSAASPSPDSIEHLQLGLCCSAALITGISVTPYQSFFQPRAPVYAPRACSLRLETEDGQGYFQSEQLPLANVFQEQHFTFVRPALFLGGRARLLFHGMQQRQTIQDSDDFYLCISHVRVSGFELPPGHLQAPVDWAVPGSSVRDLQYIPYAPSRAYALRKELYKYSNVNIANILLPRVRLDAL